MIALNPQQQAAVTAEDGPALVLAGAGTGKTRVIVERMAWLVEERGVDPRQLLALTFTNKAAAEMRARFAARLGVESVSAWMGTFHSFGLFLLRREIEGLGRRRDFTVFDDADQLSLMKKLVKDLPGGHERVSPRDALGWISRLKQELKTPPEDEDGDPEARALRWLWTRYHAALEQARGVDFDDLLCLPARLFESKPELAAKYRRRYRHVLVDEYQDTNHAQYRIARALAGENGNLFAVGDEDQSIYSWRGADIRNVLDFAEDFPGAQVLRLEENYRSTAPILAAANRLAAHNEMRLGKQLRAAMGDGPPVCAHVAEDAVEEARFVVEDMVRRGHAPGACAVLYRTNAQSRVLEEALLRRGINYAVVGGTKFYARKEIKDILAYLRLLVNPDDDISLRRIINVPSRGAGAATLERIEEYASARGCPLFQVLRDVELDQSLSARARNTLHDFVQLIDDLAHEARTAPVAQVAEDVITRVGYRAYVEQSDDKNFLDRIELVDEFVAGCARHDAEGGGPLLEYLQELALITDIDAWDREAPAVTLMTAHGAKGLEFDTVYVTGLEEGLFPLLGEFDDWGGALEEERRLCYVAMTRARRELTLTCALERIVYGRTSSDRRPSRFFAEAGVEAPLPDSLRIAAGRASMQPRVAPRPAVPANGGGSVAARAAAGPDSGEAGYRVGMQVRHAKFGRGTVMQVIGNGAKRRVRIRFQTGRVATLMASVSPLEIVEG